MLIHRYRCCRISQLATGCEWLTYFGIKECTSFFWATFCHFLPSNSPKNKNFNIYIYYTGPEIWCVTDVTIFHFGPFLALLPSTPGDIIILYKCTKNHDYMLYRFWDMVCERVNCYFDFWLFFALPDPPPNPPNSPKIKILKRWKKYLEISSFYICVPKIMMRSCTIRILRYGARQTDKRTEKVTYEVGTPPNKEKKFPDKKLVGLSAKYWIYFLM